MRGLLRRLRYLVRHRAFDTDLAEELEFHRAMKQQELERAGLEPDAAAFRTRHALGSLALATDRARDVWLPVWLQGLGPDVRLGARMLRRTPLVSAVAVLSLALGIGATTAIFALIDSLLLRPLPGVVNPGRLVTLSSGPATDTAPRWSYAFWKEIEQRSQAFGGAVAWSNSRFDLSTGGDAVRVDGALVSGDFFHHLGCHRADRPRHSRPPTMSTGELLVVPSRSSATTSGMRGLPDHLRYSARP